MFRKLLLLTALITTLIAGCKQPEKDEKLDAVVVAAGGHGELASTTIARPKQPISTLLNGSLGAGGGFLIGASKDHIADDPKNREAAAQASERAKHEPAKADDVRPGKSADLNEDGYVTVDEVAALRQANLSDDETLDWLRRTGQVFELSDFQEDYLRARRVSDVVLQAIRTTL